MRRCACIAVLFSVLLLQLSSCARKSLSPDELQSEITTALSLAADADSSLRLLREGRLLSTFFEGHIEKLSDEARSASQELRSRAVADPVMALQVRECQRDLDVLIAALAIAGQHSGTSLTDAGEQIAATHKALESLAAAQ